MNQFNQVFCLLQSAAEKWPQSDALKTKKKSISYSDLYELALSFYLFLSYQGVKRQDRILVVSENRIEVVALYFGILKHQAVFCPIYHNTPDERVKYIESDSLSSHTIYAEDEGLYFDSEWHSYKSIIKDFQPEKIKKNSDFSHKADDLACLIYTSGSTGNPKGVASLHRQVLFATASISKVVDYQEKDCVFCASPFSFDYGLYQIFICLEKGASLYLANQKESGPLLIKSLRDSCASVFAAVPTQLNTLSTLAKKVRSRPGFLRNITTTGAAVPQTTLNSMYENFPNVSIQLMYGLTECKRVSISPPNKHLLKPGTCGLPIPGTDVLIIDEEGNELPADKEGLIVVRGPHLMSGYWRDPIKTDTTFTRRNAVTRELITGDYGWLDNDGYLYCTGRKDDIFKQKGFRVSCIEIESAATSLESVYSSVLLPPNEKKGSVLFVVSDDEPSVIREKLRRKIEDYKIPSKIRVLEELPLNLNGKINKNQLNELV